MPLLISISKGFSKSILLLFLLIAFMQINAADCAEQTYYSIHLASFKNLRNANAFVNKLKIKEKVVFWKETDIPGKGIFYRVYLGKYSNEAEAFEFWEKLKKAGVVSYYGISLLSG